MTFFLAKMPIRKFLSCSVTPGIPGEDEHGERRSRTDAAKKLLDGLPLLEWLAAAHGEVLDGRDQLAEALHEFADGQCCAARVPVHLWIESARVSEPPLHTQHGALARPVGFA
jgi:hypothetical protein